MKRILIVLVVLVMGSVASATIVQGIDIDFVTIGNAGNAADTQVMTTDGTTGYGAVNYEYQIGKYEVTNAQWNVFVLAAGVPTGNNSSAYGDSAFYKGTNVPTASVSWYEAAQFCNYLTSGDKSKGVYQFSGNNTNPGDFLDVNRDLAVSTYGTIYMFPTEDEWYKAAYYKPDRSGYSKYPNGRNTIPPADNGWNYANGAYGGPWNVGIGTMEQNGTFDMMGNIKEWNETLRGSSRGLRGGSCLEFDVSLRSSIRVFSKPYVEYKVIGFRVASVAEPTILEIAVDIQPGSCPNPLRVNFMGNGVYPVAIVGSEDFDVTTIDVDTITLEGVAVLRGSVEDVSHSGDVCELGPDGIPDLVLKFRRTDIIAALEDLYGDITAIPNREELSLTLSGETNDGVLIAGTDSLRILNRGAIKRKKGKK